MFRIRNTKEFKEAVEKDRMAHEALRHLSHESLKEIEEKAAGIKRRGPYTVIDTEIIKQTYKPIPLKCNWDTGEELKKQSTPKNTGIPRIFQALALRLKNVWTWFCR